jgi:hypothetical protein
MQETLLNGFLVQLGRGFELNVGVIDETRTNYYTNIYPYEHPIRRLRLTSSVILTP